MVTDRAFTSREADRQRGTSGRQPPFCRRCVVHGPHRLPLARFAPEVWELALRVCPFRSLGSRRRLVSGCRSPPGRGGSGGVVHGCHDCSCPPAFCGCPKKNGSDQAIGRSRGGLTTKIHASVDALGNPIRLILTGGQIADVTQGAVLTVGIQTTAVTADKGYDSDELVETIEATGAMANIPPRSNRKNKRPVDWHRYKARHLVECFFNRLKQFRRIATRYDKLANRFNAFLHLACAYVWLL